MGTPGCLHPWVSWLRMGSSETCSPKHSTNSLEFVLSALCICFPQTFNALLVGIFPGSPSTTAASGNILWMSGGSLYVWIIRSPLSMLWGEDNCSHLLDLPERRWRVSDCVGHSNEGGDEVERAAGFED